MKNLRCLLPALLIAVFAIAGCSKNNSTNPPDNGGNTGNGPVISSFTATPSSVDFNTTADSAVLSWSLDGTQTSVSIDKGVGDQTNNSDESVTVFPTATTTYTLTAKSSAGTSTKTVTVTVTNNTADPNSPPSPIQLTASGGSTSPSTINLSWTEPSGGTTAAHYIIERWSIVQSLDTINAAAQGPNSYSDAKLFPSVVYYYRIKAVSSTGAASAWSNTAFATAPGQMPSIGTISIVPTTVPTLTPGQSQQFTAIAYDASSNQIPIAQTSFVWSSDNAQVVVVNGSGLATALPKQGSANITASLPNDQYGDLTPSNAVNVAVASQSSSTLVLFYGSAPTDFTNYLGPLTASGVTFDQISDLSGGGTPAFTLQQIQGYSKVVVIVSNSLYISNGALSILAQYAALGSKTLVIIGGGGEEQLTSGTLATYVGVSNDGYNGINDINPIVQGQSGTAFAGLTFTKQDVSNYVDDITLADNSTCKANLVGTLVSDNSQFTMGIQGTITGASGNSQFLYAGMSIDVVDAANQNAFVKDFMNF